MHFVVKLLHFGNSAILLKENFVHVSLWIVVVRHVSIINCLLEDDGALICLRFFRQVVHVLGLGESEV